MNIIRIVHEKGHFEVKRAKKKLENEFYIPKVKKKINKNREVYSKLPFLNFSQPKML